MKTKETLIKQIEEKIFLYAEKISTPNNLIPLINQSNDFGQPYVEVDDSGIMYFVARERGEEQVRRSTILIEDLLYWIFSGITFSMACDYELKNRIKNQDSRKMIFEKQQDMLKKININWAYKDKW